MADAIIVLTMDKIAFKCEDCTEIIPYRIVMNIIFNNKVVYKKLFLLNYDLYNISVDKNKLFSTINNKYYFSTFPTKEHKGKYVINFINKLNKDPQDVRNFILTIYFLLKYVYKIIPCWYIYDYNDLKWLINNYKGYKIYNTNRFHVSSIIIKDKLPNIPYNAEIINNMIVNYCNTQINNTNLVRYVDKIDNISSLLELYQSFLSL
ncbi:ORF MSV088 hypothetical protein [Melanoplus sanguinipes entomopoxvirus]|uniref:Uncharacterized protein n=1 Tax=Melanoplus sanguinipes entomopoxvirus TaxID=83191 RepID=Q9YW04_MSEPV|nr:ORF MSV088 hypothetical protein [Melanoplus sanguinipes entomopoxvirus]AAC97639.1 ORF MSV088 hypothetical protein [Melanoplus sanguinipes entomopoxvirus 'O']